MACMIIAVTSGGESENVSATPSLGEPWRRSFTPTVMRTPAVTTTPDPSGSNAILFQAPLWVTLAISLTNTIGPLLFVLDAYNYSAYGDYISKTVVNKVSSISEGNSATFNYDVNTDVTGRVNSLTPTGAGSPEGTKTVFTYY